MKKAFINLAFAVGGLAFLVLAAYVVFGEELSNKAKGLTIVGTGVLLIGAGYRDIALGRYTRGQVSARKEKHPVLFWAYVILFDFELGIILIILGLCSFSSSQEFAQLKSTILSKHMPGQQSSRSTAPGADCVPVT